MWIGSNTIIMPGVTIKNVVFWGAAAQSIYRLIQLSLVD